MQYATIADSIGTVITNVPPGAYTYEQARTLIRYLHSVLRQEQITYPSVEAALAGRQEWKRKLAPYAAAIQVTQHQNTVTLSLVIFEPAVNGLA